MLIGKKSWDCGLVTAFAAAALLFVAATATAKTVYVDGVNGNDAWDGLCEEWDGGTCGPKKTIQAGITVSVDGDEVIVADATYTGTGNRDLRLYGKGIWLHSANGSQSCIMDGLNATIPAFTFYTEGPDSIIDGFMIKRFSAS